VVEQKLFDRRIKTSATTLALVVYNPPITFHRVSIYKSIGLTYQQSTAVFA